MSDMADMLWQEFGVETEEHFELIEPLLVAADSRPVTGDEIAQLFRSFHSVKGLSRAMDLAGMERLAHVAEDLLGLVREGQRPLDGPAIALLLAALDALKVLRETAITSRADAPPPSDLVEELARACEGGAPTTPAPAAPAAPASVPSQAAPAAPAPAAAPPPVPPDPPAEAPLALGADPEMLTFYAEMMEEHLPVLARAVVNAGGDAEARARALESIEVLHHASLAMGFEGTAGHLADMRAVLAAPTPAPDRHLLTDSLGHIRAHLELIAREMPGGGAPSQALAERLRIALQTELHSLVEGALGVLARFGAGGPGEAPGDGGAGLAPESDDVLAEEMARLARSVCTFFLFLDLSQAAKLLLMVEDVYTRVARSELFVHPEILALTNEVFQRVTELADDTGRSGDFPDQVVDGLLARFRESLLASTRAGEDTPPVMALKAVLAQYDINDSLVEILSVQNIHDLVSAVEQGRHQIYEILADLEGDERLAMAFVEWLKAQCTPITNRTVFKGEGTWFEFLVVSSAPPPAVEEGIKALDPEGRRLRIRPCLIRPEAPAATAAARPAARPPEEAPAAQPSGRAAGVMRVRGETVDHLMAQVGELVTLGNMMRTATRGAGAAQALRRLGEAIRASSLAGGPALGWLETLEGAWAGLEACEEQLGSAVVRLEEATLDLRVVALETVFNRFPRVVRDVAQSCGKQVRLETEGAEVRIDKGMLDLLMDPLMHMVRNAIDHGIERPDERAARGKPVPATVRLSALSRGNRVEIRITDDGRGLDLARIRERAVERGLVSAADAPHLDDEAVSAFIFDPGFSTAETVSALSGRGVGMDVVRSNVQRLGGTMTIETRAGQGSTFILVLPLSAAIQKVLLVEAGGRTLAIPERFLAEIHQIRPEETQTVRGRPAILLRQATMPIFSLSDLLGFSSETATTPGSFSQRPLVILHNGRHRLGLAVDRLHRRQDLFVKEIPPVLAAIPGIGGASIAGDGTVVLILDGDDLFRLAEGRAETGIRKGDKGKTQQTEGIGHPA
ncbi:chemotaxis protein CheA [Pararhodospirillum oryzae]|uniref:Chemotaxis protein CheA n=1 Tax=Pararhodospirillum oryzae TaxID=478448 RepID=A0A512H361_9PROT|nr:chemotaxis protein CheA [Pararhodospirillum oryzae]GEO79902.1 hypothetical protein ROR02_00330 [Pararhodospirillum oryzae]